MPITLRDRGAIVERRRGPLPRSDRGGEALRSIGGAVALLVDADPVRKHYPAMRSTFVGLTCLGALLLQGCLSVLSHSYSGVALNRHPSVSATDSTWGFLHLTEPLIENLVVDLTHKLEDGCLGASLENVQTKLTIREFVLFQIYDVRLSAQCAGPLSPKAVPPLN
ncbi:MAG TPA: hypothetical protein VH560_13495 [Polyangia bacterium]|nr:hypothetical protein [Polyangia bacterium]